MTTDKPPFASAAIGLVFWAWEFDTTHGITEHKLQRHEEGYWLGFKIEILWFTVMTGVGTR